VGHTPDVELADPEDPEDPDDAVDSEDPEDPEDPDPPPTPPMPKIVVLPTVLVEVEEPEVMTDSRAEVVIAEEDPVAWVLLGIILEPL